VVGEKGEFCDASQAEPLPPPDRTECAIVVEAERRRGRGIDGASRWTMQGSAGASEAGAGGGDAIGDRRGIGKGLTGNCARWATMEFSRAGRGRGAGGTAEVQGLIFFDCGGKSNGVPCRRAEVNLRTAIFSAEG
jgi:hypothetical protein